MVVVSVIDVSGAGSVLAGGVSVGGGVSSGGVTAIVSEVTGSVGG